MEYTTIEAQLPVKAIELLDTYCKCVGESRQDMIEAAVMQFLDERQDSGSTEYCKQALAFWTEYQAHYQAHYQAQ
jgi:hypothetical protein